MRRLRGSTSQRRFIFIADTSSSTGAGLANLTHNSAGLVGYYIAGDLNNEVQITLVTATLGTFASGGFVAVDNTNMPGWYEVGIPDAALDGGNQVAIQYRGATNMVPVNVYIELDAVDYQDATAFGLSRIDQTIGSRATQTSVDTLASYIDTEVAAIKAKTDNLPSDPADASDIATSFGTVNSTLSTIASYVDTEVAAIKAKTDLISAFPSNFSAMVINAANGHVAAALHNAQPNSIPEDAFQSGALSARALNADAANEIATAVSGIQVISRLDSMLEDNGSGQFRFDTIALEMAPGGAGAGGTDWTANERTAIRAILGVPTSGTTPTDPTTGILDEIRDKTALITSGSVQTSIPVTAQGQINGPLYIGDDYLTANGRQFDWTIALPTGFVAATSTCKFGMIFEDESGVSEFNLSGTVADVGSGNVRLRFELPRATTGALKAGYHRWSTEIVSATGVEVTAVAYSDRKLVEWREKQT